MRLPILKTKRARERLDAFAGTTDGFELAELDFQMRGPGNLLGERQHGMPPFRIADLFRDRAELELARADAARLVNEQDVLTQPDWERVRRMVVNRYGKVLELGDVG